MGDSPETALIRYRTRVLARAEDSPWSNDTAPNDRLGERYITYRYRLPSNFDDPLEELAVALELRDWERGLPSDEIRLSKLDFMPAFGLLADPGQFDVVDSRPTFTQRFGLGGVVMGVAMIVAAVALFLFLAPDLWAGLILVFSVGIVGCIAAAHIYFGIFAGTRPGFGLTDRPTTTTVHLYEDDGYLVEVDLDTNTYDHDPEVEQLFLAELGALVEREEKLLD